jgi:hypothetical protein
LKYTDPLGEDIVLTGTEAEQREALERIRKLLGEERFKLVDFNQRNIEGLGNVTVIDFGSEENRRKFEAVGGNNAYEKEFSEGMADIIGSKDHVEYRIAETFKANNCLLCVCVTETRSTAKFGGAATLNRDESLTGNVQIFVSRNATYQAFFNLEAQRKFVKISSDGDSLLFTPEQVDAHEFGHAHNAIRWKMRVEPWYRAVRWENILRHRQGSSNTRITH